MGERKLYAGIVSGLDQKARVNEIQQLKDGLLSDLTHDVHIALEATFEIQKLNERGGIVRLIKKITNFIGIDFIGNVYW